MDLTWHLQYNHYPPVSTQMVPWCELAIALVRGGEGDRILKSGGITLERNNKPVTAYELVETLHLQDFVEGAE